MEEKKETTEEKEERKVIEIPLEFRTKARITPREYRALSNLARRDPRKFWAMFAETEIDWFKKPESGWLANLDKVLDESEKPFYKWFVGGKLNVSYNCVDRQRAKNPHKAAFVWEGEPGDSKILTYENLYWEVNKFTDRLKSLGVKKGDRVTIYLPMIPELPVAMLACARIGAIHSVVFGGFSAKALKERIEDAESSLLITCDGYYRAGKVVNSFKNALEALKDSYSVRNVVIVRRTRETLEFPEYRPHYGPSFWFWDELMLGPRVYCEPEEMDAEDPLFIMYTSGSTGKPKGVIHTTAGYLLYGHLTYKWIFDIKPEDIYWCTADIGWITGHTYIVYAPLSNGATVFMYEGVPSYPDCGKWWELIDKWGISIFYTAPTAIRALMREGEEWPKKYHLETLRLLGTVGEPINPIAWLWYYDNIGRGKCPIVDTWWQTETGGILITTLPGVHKMKPGSAGFPFPGIEVDIIEHKEEDEDDETPDLNRPQVPTGVMGKLIITKPWPGMLRSLWKNPERYIKTYWKKFGNYLPNDGAVEDEDGYLWLKGRIDDVINVSGHNIGTGEVEDALVGYLAVAEAAIVGRPHPVTDNELYAFLILKVNIESTEELKKALIQHVRKELGPTYTIVKIQFVSKLPKTRSGKIMRRILKKIARNEIDPVGFGDTSTLDDPEVVEEIIAGRL